MLHSPGIGGSALGEFDTTKIKGEMQRLSLVWGDTGQTSGVIAGPFQGIGVCVSVNVIEQGKVETFAVGSMDATTGVLTELPIDPLAMNSGGIAICAHGCDDPCAGKRCRMVVGKSFVFVGGRPNGGVWSAQMWSNVVQMRCTYMSLTCLSLFARSRGPQRLQHK